MKKILIILCIFVSLISLSSCSVIEVINNKMESNINFSVDFIFLSYDEEIGFTVYEADIHKTLKSGEVIILSDYIPSNEINGKKFVGWYEDSNLIYEYKVNEIKIISHIVVYGKLE